LEARPRTPKIATRNTRGGVQEFVDVLDELLAHAGCEH
jgi:hypothetical protein